MAVVGSTLGLPSAQDWVSLKMLSLLISLLVVAGMIWLVIDYSRMLILRRKMVRNRAILYSIMAADIFKASRSVTVTNYRKHPSATREQALDILRTTFQLTEFTSDNVLDRAKSNSLD